MKIPVDRFRAYAIRPIGIRLRKTYEISVAYGKMNG
jgi:hypothetical protein